MQFCVLASLWCWNVLSACAAPAERTACNVDALSKWQLGPYALHPENQINFVEAVRRLKVLGSILGPSVCYIDAPTSNGSGQEPGPR